ncbi:MAG: hypothetical protein LUF26_05805 [Firmicutes bacterium]|nr:hypothetical protein [Bacillota bacterium]
MLENITLCDDTLYGPTVTVNDTTFHLFELKNNLTLKFGDLSVQFTVDTKDKTIKTLIGFDGLSESGSTGTDYTGQGEWTKSYTQMKSIYKALNGKDVTDYKSAMKKFDSLYDGLKGNEQNLFLNIKGTIAGYLEWSYESSTPSLSEGGLVIKASASGSLDSRIAAFPAAYVTVGLSVSATGSIAVAFNGASNPLSVSSKLSLSPTLNVGVGLGSKKTETYIEGGLKGALSANIMAVTGKFAQNTSEYNPLTVTVTGSLYLKWQIFLLGDEKEWELASKQLYPDNDVSVSALGLMSVDSDDGELMPRDYLNNGGISLLSLNDAASFEKSSLYPYSEPTLVLLDSGERLLIWIDDNGEKADADRTSLYYSIESGGTWSEPQTVYDNDGYNGSPVVYSDGGNVYVLWQRASESLGDSAELEDMTAVMDLYMTVFDGESFCEPMCVSDSANAEMIYDISAAGDGIAAVWVENSENDPFMSEGTNTIYRREYTDGAWSDADAVLQTDGMIDDTIIYGDSVIWVSSTDEDGVIYRDDTQIAQTSGETNIQLVGDDLYYISDGVLYCYDLTAETTAETGIEDITNFEIVESDGQMTVFTLVSTGFTCELYENIYDGEAWGEWTQLTNDNKYIRNYSPVIASDGSLSIALNSIDVDEGSENVYSTATLTVLDDYTYSDIVVDETMYYTDEVMAGETVNLCFDVFNNSRSEIDSVKTVLTDSSGNVLQTAYVDADLTAGEEKALSVPYIIPDDMTLSELTVTVSADIDEADDSNNTASCTIGYADLEISDLEISAGNGSAKIIGTLANTGFTDVSNAAVEVYNSNISDELLTTLDIGEVDAGESVEIEYELPESYLSLDDEDILYGIFFTALTADTEEDYENNDEKIVFGDLSEEVSATTEPTASPTATPTVTPTAEPTTTPSPTVTPTAIPIVEPTSTPTAMPTVEPTITPTLTPTATSTATPTSTPTPTPTPTTTPMATPTAIPTATPEVSGEEECSINEVAIENGKISVDIENIPDSGTLIAAAYSDNGRLIGVTLIDIETDSLDDIALNLDDAEYITVFIWNDIYSMKPLCKEKTQGL